MSMEPRVCKFCGKEFIPTNGMQKYCRNQHYKTCVVCGEKFEVPAGRLRSSDCRNTCSTKCLSQLRQTTNLERYGSANPAGNKDIQEKIRKTTRERYGVDYGAQSQQAKEKTKQTNREKYGVDYYQQTPEYKEKVFETNLERYGTKWSGSSKVVREKIKQTNLERYGAENPWGCEEVQEKCKNTYYEKTGYTTPFANPEVREKSRKTLLEHYGVEHPYQSPEIRKRFQETTKEHYGVENPMQSKEVLEKTQQTVLERYGDTCYLQSEEGLRKTEETMLKKHGVRWASQTEDWLLSRMSDTSKIDNMLKFKSDPVSYLDNFEGTNSLKNVSESIGVADSTLGQFILEHSLQDHIEYVFSYMEQAVIEFIESLDFDIIVEKNTHDVITPEELDLYLPQYNLAIECNPTVTHNSTLEDPWGGEPKSLDYHKTKSDMCDEKGIFLFHIFGYQWTWKQDIVKGILKQFLGKYDELVEFEDCVVKGVDDLEIEDFFQNYSLRMEGIPDSNLGLYYDETLVAAMIFSTNDDRCEIQGFAENFDFCVPDYQVKFVNYLLEHNNFSVVYGLSNRGYEPNWVFEKCGFEKLNILDPSPTWIDLNTDRVICGQKDKYSVEVYDAGSILWKYQN